MKTTGWKSKLEEVYITVGDEELVSQIKEIETAQKMNNFGKSFQLINKITERKTTRQGQLKGDKREERVNTWFNHSVTLLGNNPNTDDEEEIPPILHNVKINSSSFDMAEYIKAKKSIVEGNSCGEDGITHEVLKRCDLD